MTSGATPTTTGTPKPPPPKRDYLRLGDRGREVLALQQRLSELGYWLGEPDGGFGFLTQQAVWALQKSAGLGRAAATLTGEPALAKSTTATIRRKLIAVPARVASSARRLTLHPAQGLALGERVDPALHPRLRPPTATART